MLMRRAAINHPERTPPSWELYFPGEKFIPTDRKADLICRLVDFFNSKDGTSFSSNVRLGSGAYSLVLDYQVLRGKCTCEHLFAALQVQPVEAVAALGAALYEVIFNTAPIASKQFRPGKIRVRLINYGESMIPMRALKSNYIGRAVSLQGTVVRVSPVKAMVKRLEFLCSKCGGASSLALADGKYVTPTRCATEHCRSKIFLPNRANAVTADWQKIRIQEQQGAMLNGMREEGRIPRTVECELMHEMVDACVPGDSVVVFGIVKAMSTETDMGGGKGKGGKGQQQSLLFLYIDAISLVNTKRREVLLANAGTPLPAPAHAAVGENESRDASTTPAGLGLAHGHANAGNEVPFNAASCSDGAAAQPVPLPASVPAAPAAVMDVVPAGSTSCSGGGAVAGPSGWTFSARDLTFVAHFSEEYGADRLRQLVQSLCPSIYGHDFVKAGLLLALLGGVQQGAGERDKVPTRGDIHVLVVGDPGLGKSQLLKGAANVAPRGIYVCGSSSTNAGLSVAVVKDAMTGDFVFEAGALVLADGGACCVDELDKMASEHQALLEVMEQQSVSVAKAGMCTSLQARCSVLAAANPAGGHYNRAKTVNENLKMSAPLLSRFDLVFVIQDKPDELLDQRLSEHIMAMHAGTGDRIAKTRDALLASQTAIASLPAPLSGAGAFPDGDVVSHTTAGGATGSHYSGVGITGGAVDARRHSLLRRLKLNPGEKFEPVPPQLIRKYIAYARQYCYPKLSNEAGDILAGFYKELRANTRSAEGIPVTTRQLESLIRLAQARARVELRELVTAADAQDVVELMKESLYDKFADEYGCVDFGRSSGMSKHKEAKRYLGALQKLSEAQAKSIFTVSELFSLADDIQLAVPDVNEFLISLNTAGYLLKKGPRCYQVQVSSGYSTQF